MIYIAPTFGENLDACWWTRVLRTSSNSPVV